MNMLDCKQQQQQQQQHQHQQQAPASSTSAVAASASAAPVSTSSGFEHELMIPMSMNMNMNSKSFSELLAEDDDHTKNNKDVSDEPQQRFGSQVKNSNNSSTARFRSMTPSSIPIPKSPGLFTVPPGLSPTTLLDSPVLLPASQALVSPTTGTYPLLPFSFDQTSNDVFKNMDLGAASSGFAFKPHLDSPFGFDFSPLGNMGTFGFDQQQVFKGHHNETQMYSTPNNLSEQFSVPPLQAGDGAAAPEDSFDDQQQQQSSDSQMNSEVNQLAAYAPCTLEKPTDDGYHWRKYGQKQVKGSECPRSYYKCTHPGCPTKKKVERSPDGQVTEIVYRGAHNHPKPQATRRAGSISNRPSHDDGETVEGPISVKIEDPASNLQAQNSAGTPEQSSLSASDEDDGRTPSNYPGEEAEEDENEPNSKRIKSEPNAMDIIGATRTIREPRVVVQTTSDIDILDDGYRWRKYGQKVVKGNPNPRSYYKCTNPGCQVRKHVERAAHDQKAVITTYEGKHSHDVPAPRSSSHSSAGIGNSSVPGLPNNAIPPAAGAAVNLSAPDIQGAVSQYENQHDFGNDYDRSLGAQLNYGMFGLQNKQGEIHQSTEMASSHAMQLKHASHVITGAGLNNQAMHSYFGQHSEVANGLIRPKEELTESFRFNTSLH